MREAYDARFSTIREIFSDVDSILTLMRQRCQESDFSISLRVAIQFEVVNMGQGQSRNFTSVLGLQQAPQGDNPNNNNHQSTIQNSHQQLSAVPPANNQQPLQSGNLHNNNPSANTQLAASVLDIIPQEIWKNHIIPYLHSGSYVQVITEKPNQEQKDKIITKIASFLQPVRFVVHGYLLIRYPGNTNNNNSKTTYAIGYYNPQGQYCESAVSYKSSLYNYLSNNPVVLDNSATDFTSDDPDLLRWVSRAVKDNGGQLAGVNSDVLNLSLTNKANLQFFEPNRKQEYFPILFDAVVCSEYDRAERVFKFCPELLLNQYKGSITNTGITERTFHHATAFQLAVWAGDWVMWEKMLAAIPQHLKIEYEDDLRQQLTELQEKGLTYTLDNLKACGLRILDDDPREEIKQDVIKRNTYLFIIDKKNKTYSVGFKDPNTKEYTQWTLDQDSDLSKQAETLQQALDNHRNIDQLPHCIIRDESILKLARQEIKQLGAQTEITETSSSHDLKPLLDALQEYKDQYDDWTDPQRIEHWCVIVGWVQRLLPAAAWNWWMHPDIDWWHISEKDFKRNFPEAYRPKFYDNSHLVTLTSSLGDKFAARSGRSPFWPCHVTSGCVTADLPFLNYLSQARNRMLNLLCEILNITLPINNQQIVY